MRYLFKQPLAWMVVGEFVVVAALVAVSWHVLSGTQAGGAPMALPALASPADTAVPDAPGIISPPGSSAAPLLPGLNLNAGFWRTRLSALNAAEAQLEALEWRIVHSAMDTVHRYVESVVVPEVMRAERGGR